MPGYYAARLAYSTVLRPSHPDTNFLQRPTAIFDELWTPAPATLPSTSDPGRSSPSVSTASTASPTQARRAQSIGTACEPSYPAGRILTHPDGGIGALSTEPAHQRRGLARWVTLEHLRSGRGHIADPDVELDRDGDGAGGGDLDLAGRQSRSVARGQARRLGWTYAVVHERNNASSALWADLGWERAWRCASVYRTEEDIAAGVAAPAVSRVDEADVYGGDGKHLSATP